MHHVRLHAAGGNGICVNISKKYPGKYPLKRKLLESSHSIFHPSSRKSGKERQRAAKSSDSMTSPFRPHPKCLQNDLDPCYKVHLLSLLLRI